MFMIQKRMCRSTPLVIISVIALWLLAMSVSSEEIPKDAYETAKKGFKSWLRMCEAGGRSFRSVCSDTTVDIRNVVLSEIPVKISYLISDDILKCHSGEDILTHAKLDHYYYFVTSDGEAVGTIGVSYLNGEMRVRSFSKGSRKLHTVSSMLRKQHPESEGYRLDLIDLGRGGNWFIMISNPGIDNYIITPFDDRFSRAYGVPEFIEEKRNLVPLETVMPKFKEKAKMDVECKKRGAKEFR